MTVVEDVRERYKEEVYRNFSPRDMAAASETNLAKECGKPNLRETSI